MSSLPLMPKATAVWLVDNTTLTFEQIAEFCGLHPLEVQGIADDEVAIGIQGQDPIAANELTRAEIERCEGNGKARLQRAKTNLPLPKRRTKGPRYTPVAKRQDKPDAIAWLLRHHPELKDSQIIRLVGTTKNTIEAVRERTHWNSANLTPMDPVTLGLCTQINLDLEVRKAAKWAPKPEGAESEAAPADALLPAEETQAISMEAGTIRKEEEVDADTVFAKFAKQEKEGE